MIAADGTTVVVRNATLMISFPITADVKEYDFSGDTVKVLYSFDVGERTETHVFENSEK